MIFIVHEDFEVNRILKTVSSKYCPSLISQTIAPSWIWAIPKNHHLFQAPSENVECNSIL